MSPPPARCGGAGRPNPGASPRWRTARGPRAFSRNCSRPAKKRSGRRWRPGSPAFTPDWTNPAPDDSGVALVRLFGIQMEPLLSRVNRLPEKALVEHLRIAGVTPLPATAAEALLTFTIAPAAGASVLVPAGFQAGASPATGNGGQVIFETERAVVATPATVAAIAVTVAGVVSAVDPALAGFPAFGPAPEPGQRAVDRPRGPARSGQPGPIAIARPGGRGHGRHAAATRHGRGNGARGGRTGPAGELGRAGRRQPGPRQPRPRRDRRAEQRRHRRARRARAVAAGPSARLGRAARTALAAGPAGVRRVSLAARVLRRPGERRPGPRHPDDPRRAAGAASGQPGRADPDAAEPDPGRARQHRARRGRRPGRRRIRDGSRD